MRTNGLNERYRDICDGLGWTVKEYTDGTVAIENFTNYGGNVVYEFTATNFVEDAKDAYEGFDVDDYVEMYIHRRGMNGVPLTVRGILEDGEEIAEMLRQLSEALGEV